MLFFLKHETAHRIRLSLPFCPIRPAQEEVLRYALESMPEIQRVTFYPAVGDMAITYSFGRERILKKLTAFQESNVTLLAEDLESRITMSEVKRRKLDPDVKTALRTRVVLETAADMLLPIPLQLAYHAYQLITLRDI